MDPIWRCGRFEFRLGRPLVMGIINATPDSFSDGGRFFDPRSAIAAATVMMADGADIIDIGGESTRPGAAQVSLEEELERVVAVVEGVAEAGGCVSIDTRHAPIAAECLRRGASIVNDVTGLRDPEMVEVARGSDAGLVVMHMRGEPGTMQGMAAYDDVVAEVVSFLRSRCEVLTDAGIAPSRIALDPGIGFAKTTAHNLELLRRLDEVVAIGRPVLVGASRKRFIGEITGVAEPRGRLAGSVAVALDSVMRGASIVRVHDVPETVQALAVARAIREGVSER